MKKILDSEIVAAVNKQREQAASAGLVVWEEDNFIAVAQAQLEADQKDYEKLRANRGVWEAEALKQGLEADRLKDVVKEHKAMVKEIKEGLEKMFYLELRYHSVACTVNTDGNPGIDCLVCEWQEFWQKYGSN